jgi:hypothetical protein
MSFEILVQANLLFNESRIEKYYIWAGPIFPVSNDHAKIILYAANMFLALNDR